MPPATKTIWINLVALGALLSTALGTYFAMHGSLGAKYYSGVLQTGNPKQRLNIADALADLREKGAPAVPALIALLQNPSDPAAPASARALRVIDAQQAYEYATRLTDQLSHGELVLTPAAIAVLHSLGPVAWKAIPLLRDALRNRTEHVRELIPALIDMGDYSDEVIAAILDDSRDATYAAEKWDAMLALDQLGYRALPLRPDLERLAGDPTPAVSGQAKIILSKLARTPKYAVSGLHGFFRTDLGFQEYTLEQLSKQGPYAAEAVPDVTDELRSNSALIRFLATWTLAHIGAPARTALPQLRTTAADEKSLVRDGAAEAIRILEAAP
jgi:HEAT repeat protein